MDSLRRQDRIKYGFIVKCLVTIILIDGLGIILERVLFQEL